jgi:Family of unknown function (DUF6502)
MEVDATRQQVLRFLGAVLEPVIRLMLRNGVSWKEFSELSRAKFVEVATADFGIRGRPTNVSRVAILTGLDRRDVTKLRKTPPATPTQGYQTKASQILSAWHHEPDFVDAHGRPAVLPVDGEGTTFTELVRRYAPALPVIAMIKELKNAEAIEELSDGRLRPLKRVYVPSGLSVERLQLWSSVLSDVATTIEHNATRDATEPTRFERRALNLRVDRRFLPEFRELLETEGQALLERVDDWLAAHQVIGDEHEDGIRLGAGIYHIEDRIHRRARTPQSKKATGESQ